MARSSIRLSLVLFGGVLVIAIGALLLAVLSENGKPSSSNGVVVFSKRLPEPTPLRSFTATDTEGHTITSSAITTPTVIHIFASWCPTCQAESKHFAAFLRANPTVRPIYIAVADKPQSAAKFITGAGWRSGPLINDPKRSLASSLGLSGQPNTIFVNYAGLTETVRGGAGLATLNLLGAFAAKPRPTPTTPASS